MKIKKIIAFISAVLVSGCIFSGCGNKNENTPSTNTTTTITTDSTTENTTDTQPIVTYNNKINEDGSYSIHNCVINLGDFSYKNNLNIEDYAVTDEQAQEYLNYMVSNVYTKKERIEEGVVKNGDTVIIDYVGTYKDSGEEFANDNDVRLTIGSNSFIDGFESGLEGKNIGDEVDLDLKFPEDYWSSDMANKEVNFHVTIHAVEVVSEQEATDNLIAENTDFNTIEEFLNDYKDSTQKNNYNIALVEDVFEQLDEFSSSCEFVSGIDEYTDEIFNTELEMYKYYAQMYSMEIEDYITSMFNTTYEEFVSTEKDLCNKQAKRLVILGALGIKNNIELTDDELTEILNIYINAYYGSDKTTLEAVKQQVEQDDSFKESFRETAEQVNTLNKLFDIPYETSFLNQ